MCSSQVVQKRNKTCLEKYGVPNVTQSLVIQAKSRSTSEKLYGVPYPFQAESVKAKSRATMLKRYGAENPSQVPSILEKQQRTALQSKPFVLPSGRTIFLQGCEPQVFMDLLRQGISEEDVLWRKRDVPHIWYFLGGKKHRYFPDFFIPKLNWIIEAKSPWTFELDKEENLAKQAACLAAGYRFDFMLK